MSSFSEVETLSDVTCAFCGCTWWHDDGINNPLSYQCGIGRAYRSFIIPGKESDWSLDQTLWMKCATTEWYQGNKLVMDEIDALLTRGANPNYSYRGRSVFAATLTSRSQYLHMILTLLMKAGCVLPSGDAILTAHPNRRDLVTIAVMNDDPRISALVLHAPQHDTRAVWCANPLNHTPLTTMRWTHVPPVAVLNKAANESTTIISNTTENKIDPVRLTAIELAGGRSTVGVAGGAWPTITLHAIAAASSLSRTGEHVLSWLIWAYGVDITKAVMRSSIYGNADPSLWNESPYPINTVVEMRDPRGYDLNAIHSVDTGQLIHQPMVINDKCRWIGMRVIDVARSPLNGQLIIRVTSLRLNLFDEWLAAHSSRLRIPTARSLREYNRRKRSRLANQSVVDVLSTEKPEVYRVLQETIEGVKSVRQQIQTTLITLNILPSVLHSLIVAYAL